jgi:benzoate membrane transport protein
MDDARIELAGRRREGLLAALDRHALANGAAAALLATTGPLAIFLAAAAKGGLGPREITAFIFAGYGVGGVFSIGASLYWRQPLGMAWTIPGIVLVGAALGHLGYGEVIGAYLMAGVLLTVLGATGWVGRITRALPMPIVMGMVAGVFLSFGLKVITAFGESWPIALAMVLAYLAVAVARISLPPVLGALAAGVAVMLATGAYTPPGEWAPLVAVPTVFVPEITWRAALELVVPLALTVVGIHNAQGVAVLRANGYEPPINPLTVLCGIGSLVQGAIGAPPLCVTGPANAVLNSSGARERRWAGGVVFGGLLLLFGLFAPQMTRVALGVPAAFIGALGGLAILRVLEQSFVAAFGARFPLGALVALLVTIADRPLLNVGAPFWALVFGYAVSWLLERHHFASASSADGAPPR